MKKVQMLIYKILKSLVYVNILKCTWETQIIMLETGLSFRIGIKKNAVQRNINLKITESTFINSI